MRASSHSLNRPASDDTRWDLDQIITRSSYEKQTYATIPYRNIHNTSFLSRVIERTGPEVQGRTVMVVAAKTQPASGPARHDKSLVPGME